MPAEWALEVMRKAPYITVSFIRKDGSAYGLPLYPEGRFRLRSAAVAGIGGGRAGMVFPLRSGGGEARGYRGAS